ncbi:MAG: ABC transporter substrate-binding protein [Clostridiaceae bacterium]|nr:ABC transporter substrate-binding protein [Clostridiaceae bacterium]
MKKILALLMVLCMTVTLFAGCSGNESGTAKTGGTASNTPTEETGRTDLNLALVGVVSTLDPYATSLTVDLMLFRQIYESFYYVDDYGQTHSRLALSHEISSDGLEYTFKMREDAFFHNGDPVTADDAVFSFKKAMESGVMAPYVNVISKVEKVDDLTVKITLKQSYTPFLANTAQIGIISEKAYTEAGESFGAIPNKAGTGPYMVTSYDGNTKIELAVFDKYYRGEAAIKKVTFTPMADTSTGLIAFENGELDFFEIPTANWKEINGSGKYNSVLNPTSHISYLLINPNKGILRNQDLRYAIQYAIDREAINIIAYEGLATPAYHMMHPEYIFGASEDAFAFTYDPEKAKEYLVKAGYPDGVDIGVLQHTTANYFPKIAQTVQAQLAEVGITCTLEGGQTSALVTSWRAGEFDIMNSGFNAVLDYDYFTRYTSPSISTSFLKYQDSEYDADWILEMYNKGAAELDPEKRKEIYFELDDYMARSACYIPVFYKTLPYAWDKNLNVKLDLNYYYVYEWSWN